MKKITLITVFFVVITNIADAQSEVKYFSNSCHTSVFKSKAVRNQPKQLWKFEMKLPGSTYVTINENRLFSNCSNKDFTIGYQYAIDKNTGKQIWMDSINDKLSMPVMDSKTGYFSSKSPKLYALDLATGKEKWIFSDISDMMCVTPGLTDGKIFFGTHSREWCVLNAEDGKLIKKDTSKAGICCIPSWNKEFVFFTDGSGRLYQQNINTLELTEIYKSTTGSHVGPTIVGNTGIMTDDSCTVIAVDLTTGREIWKYRVDGKLWRMPAVADEICVVVTENSHIYAFGLSDGKLLWDIKKEGFHYTSASIAEDIAYIGCGDKKLYAFEISTGKELWSVEIDDPPGQVFIENQILYFSAGKNVYAYK